VKTAHISLPAVGESSRMPSYLARPDAAEPAAAVIILQEVFGVNAYMRRITDLVASAGYVGLAINYYHRTHPDLDAPYNDEGIAVGRKAAAGVTRQTFFADLHAAMDYLNEQDFVRFNHLATWGFCFGGSMAFLSSMQRGISGAVCFYGGQIAKPLMSGEPGGLEHADEVRAPLFLAFGGADQGIPPDEVRRVEQTLEAKHKRFELKLYPEQGHGFFRESSQKFDVPDIADAWARVQAFLQKTLA